MNEEKTTAAFWVSFFLEAGIPQEIAAEYAVKFITDGIQEKILPDLTKEYLRSMAVFDLRDIIAILKQSKRHLEKITSKKNKETTVMKATKHGHEHLLGDKQIPTSTDEIIKKKVPQMNTVSNSSPFKKMKCAKGKEEIDWVTEQLDLN